MTDIGTFAGVAVAMLVAHQVGDHWSQTHHQAMTKGQPGRVGRAACARHVASYTVGTAVAVLALWGAFQLDISWLGFAAGQLVSAATHYWADRRSTLAWLAASLGKAEFHALGAPREHRIAVDRVVRHELPDGGHTLSLETDVVPLDNPSLGTGAYALDQSWHWGWLGVSAFLTAVL